MLRLRLWKRTVQKVNLEEKEEGRKAESLLLTQASHTTRTHAQMELSRKQ